MAIKLETGRGDIKITNRVMLKMIASITTSCYGVVGLAIGGKKLKSDTVSHLSKGIKIKVDDSKLFIDVHIITSYGVNMNTVSESIRSNIKYQMEDMTGVEVGVVNVIVETLKVEE